MSDLHALASRLEALERDGRRLARTNRFLTGLAGAAVLVAGLAFLVGQRPTAHAQEKKEKVVEAEKFLLKDGAGTVRAALFMGANGPKYDLYDEKGTLRATLALGKNGDPAIVFFGADRKQQVTLAVEGIKRFLTLHDDKGIVRSMFTTVGPTQLLAFTNEAGKVRTMLTDNPNGRGLIMEDNNGKTRMSMTLEKDRPVFKILDADEKALYEKP